MGSLAHLQQFMTSAWNQHGCVGAGCQPMPLCVRVRILCLFVLTCFRGRLRLSSRRLRQEPAMHPHHPHADDHGHPVLIKHPSTPTHPTTWHDPASVAIFIPGGDHPDQLNGVPMMLAGAPPADQIGAAGGFDEPPMPHVPGKRPAAGAVVVEDDGRVWLVNPTNRFGGYTTTFPKGTVEPGATLRDTAVVEVFQEAGLQVQLTGWLTDVRRTTSLTRFYLARRVGGSPAAMGWETQATVLAPLKSLSRMLTAPADRPVLAALLAYLEN